MEKQLIISVGREYGSGGHEIAAEKNLDMQQLRGLDEKHRSRLASRTVRGYSSSPEENLYLLQFDYLKNKAASGESFVIVGRCSESILKEYDGLVSIFVLGDMDRKIERIMRLYQLSKEQAVRKIREKDMKRKRYHNGHCDGRWGDSRNYDITINSSKLGIDRIVTLLADYIDQRRMQR